MINARKAVGIILLVVGATSTALASVSTPEIAAGSATSALALVSGMVMMFRSRRK